MKKYVCTILILFMIAGVIFPVQGIENNIVKGQVLSIDKNADKEYENEIIKIKILEGIYKGEEFDTEHFSIEYSQESFEIHKGMKVLVRMIEDENGKVKANITNVSREDHLMILMVVFLLAVVLFGRLRGVLSVASLGVSGLIILKFMIPMILKGYAPITISILCTIMIILISFILIAGFTKKSYVAILGTICGTIAAGILANIFTKLCAITGLASEEVGFLVREVGVAIDFRGLYLSGVIIGAIGVVMDVAMTITSVIFELRKKSSNTTFWGLMHSGLEVGKDVMATMVNTLILAYVGGSMPLFLMLHYYNLPVGQMLSKEIVATEVIRSLSGSIGLILTIPITSFIASTVAQNVKKG